MPKIPRSPRPSRKKRQQGSPRKGKSKPIAKPSDFNNLPNFESPVVQAAHLYAVSKDLLQQNADLVAKESRIRHPQRDDSEVDELHKSTSEKTVAGRYNTARNNVLVSVNTPTVLAQDGPLLYVNESEAGDSFRNVPKINTDGIDHCRPHSTQTSVGLLGSPRARCQYSSNETVWIRKFELSPRKLFLPQQNQHQRPQTTQATSRHDSRANAPPSNSSNAFKAIQRVVAARKPRTVRVNSESHLAEYRELYESTMETEHTPLRSARDRDTLPAASCSHLRTQALLEKWRDSSDHVLFDLDADTPRKVRETGDACRRYHGFCKELGVVPSARVLESLAFCDDGQSGLPTKEVTSNSTRRQSTRVRHKTKGHTIKLLLAHQSMGDKGVEATCSTLEVLYLTPDVLRAIQLDLGANCIGKTGAVCVGKLVSSTPVTTLSLQEQPSRTFGTTGCCALLSAAIPSQRLDVLVLGLLDLSGNNLGDGIAKLLHTVITRAPLLQHLVLARNRLGKRTCEALASALSPEWRDPGDPLSSLVLGWNNLGSGGGLAISSGLQIGMCVARLDLSFSGLSDDVAVALASALGQNNCALLNELNLSRNRIGTVGGCALAECLETNTHLSTLYMGFNPLSATASFAFVNALKQNNTLLKLGLENGHLSADSWGDHQRTSAVTDPNNPPDETDTAAAAERTQPKRSSRISKARNIQSGGAVETMTEELKVEEVDATQLTSTLPYRGHGDSAQELHELVVRVNTARRRALFLTKQAKIAVSPRAEIHASNEPSDTSLPSITQARQQKLPRFNIGNMTVLAGPPVHVALEYPPRTRSITSASMNNIGVDEDEAISILEDEKDGPPEQTTDGNDSVFAERAAECDSEALYDTMSVVRLAFSHDWKLLHARLLSALARRRRNHQPQEQKDDTTEQRNSLDDSLEQVIEQIKRVFREHYATLSDIATYYAIRPSDDPRFLNSKAFMQIMKDCRVTENTNAKESARLTNDDLRLIFVSANVPGQENDRILESLRAEREQQREALRIQQAVTDAPSDDADAEDTCENDKNYDSELNSTPPDTMRSDGASSRSSSKHQLQITAVQLTLAGVKRMTTPPLRHSTAVTTSEPSISTTTATTTTTSTPSVSPRSSHHSAEQETQQAHVNLTDNPRNKLVRHEFLLALVLIAKRKYCHIRHGDVTQDRSEALQAIPAALAQLLKEHILLHGELHHANRWRRDHLYWYDVHYVLSEHEPLLRDLYTDMTSALSLECNGLLTSKAWFDFVQRTGILSPTFTTLEAMRAFTFSNMMVKRDLGRDRSAQARDAANRLSWCEFQEAIVRVAAFKCANELGLDPEANVSMRLCQLLLVIFKALRLQDQRPLWRSYWRSLVEYDGNISDGKDWSFLAEKMHYPLIITPPQDSSFAL